MGNVTWAQGEMVAIIYQVPIKTIHSCLVFDSNFFLVMGMA